MHYLVCMQHTKTGDPAFYISLAEVHGEIDPQFTPPPWADKILLCDGCLLVTHRIDGKLWWQHRTTGWVRAYEMDCRPIITLGE